MNLSSRIKSVSNSITLKLNEKASLLLKKGHHIFNLTSGQLPFRPEYWFIERIESELNFLKSFQYSPVAGMENLRKKVIDYIQKSRAIKFDDLEDFEVDCVVSNGAKHSIYNILGTIIDPGDEVVLLSPYWVSYPEMIKFWGGIPNVVKAHNYDAFTANVEDINKVLSPRTKAIIINSPNNPSGIHYSEEWMDEFGQLMKEYPDVFIISDEIYFKINYFDPAPTYFYQFHPELLKQTIIVDGISKSFAATGLRIGYSIGSRTVMEAMAKLQSQTSSGPNSLIQRALIGLNFDLIDSYLEPIKTHLRNNSNTMREKFREMNLGKCWYQTMSAFYFMVDFKQTPVFQKYDHKESAPGTIEIEENQVDYSTEICNDLLNQLGVAIVPGTDFGMPNTARVSLVLEEAPFTEAITRLASFLADKVQK